jgi:TetR/AcrR family transcriptional regulator
LDVSEAALYRHFASKAQMFEGLLEFIEQSVFTLINHIVSREDPEASRGLRQASAIVTMLVQFAEKNPGMARVMVGDALVFESDRLQQRMNQFFDKVEAALKQCMREDAVPDAGVRAAVLNAFLVGRLQRYVRSGFRQRASDQLDASLALILRIQA